MVVLMADKAKKSFIVNTLYLAKLAEIHDDPDYICVDLIMAFNLLLLKTNEVDKTLVNTYIKLMRESVDSMEETYN